MIWDFHGISVAGDSNSPGVRARWAEVFASRPAAAGPAQIAVQLDLVANVPPGPTGRPDIRADGFIDYFLADSEVVAMMPGKGRFDFDLAQAATFAQFSDIILAEYGLLEDVLAIALAPHLRRHGAYMIHAFAAAYDGQGLLIVGDMGAGKTTTGMALLAAGWQLLANDAPLLTTAGIASYPGQLAAFSDSLRHFPELAGLAERPAASVGRPKICFEPALIWPEVWRDQAPLQAIIFPQITTRSKHLLVSLEARETLERLLPHTVEQWDRAMLPAQLSLLSGLVERAAGYELHLSSQVAALPALLQPLVT